jgi:hypothetical protein
MWRTVWFSNARLRSWFWNSVSMVVGPGAIGAELQVATHRLDPESKLAAAVCAGEGMVSAIRAQAPSTFQIPGLRNI